MIRDQPREAREPGEARRPGEAPRIRWMNLSEYLRRRPDKKSRQIVFEGEKRPFRHR